MFYEIQIFTDVIDSIDWNSVFTIVISFVSGSVIPLFLNWYKEKNSNELSENAQALQILREFTESLVQKYDKVHLANDLLEKIYFEVKEENVILKAKEFAYKEKISELQAKK